MALIDLANPTRFRALSGSLLPWLIAATVVAFGYGLTQVYFAPDDYQQGATVKIMFIHVPAAWLGMMAFTLLCLVTGSLWGRPMWGTYWVWDARLTSELVLFLMYLGVIALWRTIDDPGRAARAAAILTLVGALDLPIIKFSVDWWNTLHQPASVFRVGGSTIDPSLLLPLLTMAIAFTLLFYTLHFAAMRNEIMRRRVRTLMMMQADAAGGH
jgi:heme exporter protein C